MVLTRRRSWPATVAVTAAVLTSCGDATDGVDGAELVATTSVWADIAMNVACGEAVVAVIPAGADPHTYEPSLQDRALLEHADLIVANGSQLEEGVGELLEITDANVIEMSTRIDLINDHDEGEDEGDEHDHTGGNPHVWHDPTRVAGALDLIASALVAAGRDAGEIRRCTDAYRSELELLDAEITGLLADIPDDLRLIVSNHDSMEYFADRYGFEIIGTVLPSSTTMAESNAADLAALAELIDERAVPVIFVDESSSDADAAGLARRADVTIVALHTGSLSSDGSASTYAGMMRANATAIAEALTP